MKTVIVGATSLGVATARKLIDAGHDVVVVDRDRQALDALSDALDCGMIQGDGTLPSVLRSAAGDRADALLALTHHDEDNILSALVGRSVGFERVVPKIVNGELAPICVELELCDALFAEETMSGRLIDMLESSRDVEAGLEVAAGVRLLRIAIGEDRAGAVSALALPDGAQPIMLERDGDSRFVDSDHRLKEGDTLLVLSRMGVASEI